MKLFHWTPNKKLKKFTRKYIYAWGDLQSAKEWQKLHGGKGKIIEFKVLKARKYDNYYLAIKNNIVKT